jgi:hypothetical protein
MIDKVVKSPSIKNGETGVYHIFVNGADIAINSAQLTKGPGRFRTLYFDTFGKLPYIAKEEWPVFVEYIAGIAETGEYEETAAIMAADLLFEEMINSFEIVPDKEVLLNRDNCYYFVEHNPHGELFYVVPSATITELLNEIKIKAPLEDVSEAMVARGYKKRNTHSVKVTGVPIRCWWFLESTIKAYVSGLEDDL